MVGFDIGEAEAREQLRAIAEATGRVYADAQTPEDFVDALNTLAGEQLRVVQVRSGAGELVLRTPPGPVPGSFWKYVITDEAGTEVVKEYGDSDSTAATYQMAAGMYTVDFEPASTGEPLRFRVEIGAGQETALRLGAVRLRAPKNAWKVSLVDQRTGLATEAYGNTSSRGNFLNGPLVVPPGTYDFWLEATSSSDPAVVAQDVRVKPGAIVEVTP